MLRHESAICHHKRERDQTQKLIRANLERRCTGGIILQQPLTQHFTSLHITLHQNMSFKFCAECNNMLYPKEDKSNRRLLYQCRNCSYSELADSPRVYRHELITNIGETAGVVDDIGSDPKLPRSDRVCPKCHNNECVFFQSQQKRRDTSMVLFYVCLECKNVFRSDQA